MKTFREFNQLNEKKIVLDYSDIEDIEWDGIGRGQAPKFVDAFIVSATYKGRPMTDDELDVLNGDSDQVNQMLHGHLY